MRDSNTPLAPDSVVGNVEAHIPDLFEELHTNVMAIISPLGNLEACGSSIVFPRELSQYRVGFKH